MSVEIKLNQKELFILRSTMVRLLLFGNVPAEVCERCGEEYFSPIIADEIHRIIQSKSWIKTLSIPYAEMKT